MQTRAAAARARASGQAPIPISPPQPPPVLGRPPMQTRAAGAQARASGPGTSPIPLSPPPPPPQMRTRAAAARARANGQGISSIPLSPPPPPPQMRTRAAAAAAAAAAGGTTSMDAATSLDADGTTTDSRLLPRPAPVRPRAAAAAVRATATSLDAAAHRTTSDPDGSTHPPASQVNKNREAMMKEYIEHLEQLVQATKEKFEAKMRYQAAVMKRKHEEDHAKLLKKLKAEEIARLQKLIDEKVEGNKKLRNHLQNLKAAQHAPSGPSPAPSTSRISSPTSAHPQE